MQIILNIVLTSSIILLSALSFSIIYQTTKFFSFTHAAIISLGAYLAFSFTTHTSIPFAIGVILSILLTTVVAILFEVLVYRKLRDKKTSLQNSLVASIGLLVICQNLISIAFGDTAITLRGNDIEVGHEIFGGYITNVQVITVAVSVLIYLLVYLFMRSSLIGKYLKAVSNNYDLSRVYGINSKMIILFSVALGSSIAAIAGILMSLDNNITQIDAFNLLLYGIVAMIVGGIQNMKGVIAGSLFVASAQQLAAYCLDTKWMNAVTYAILILFLIWKPFGFHGNRIKKIEV